MAHYIARVNGEEPLVVLNDEYSWSELMKMGPFDSVVLSPGPGTVVHPKDFGVSLAAIECSDVPLLGVCLGHQGIAHYHGADIIHADEPVHGRVSKVIHSGDPLFEGIPSPWEVVRYHSLTVSRPLPPSLREIAHTECGTLMALKHIERPHWGVQFHPESILTDYGYQLISNFRDIAFTHNRKCVVPVDIDLVESQSIRRRLLTHEFKTELDSEDIFVGLYADKKDTFWLDSATESADFARFSYMGMAGAQGGELYYCDENSAKRQAQGDELLARLEESLYDPVSSDEDLPFTFKGGWVGYFGYEMKSLFGAKLKHHSEHPDALWLHADRFLVFDHVDKRAWAVSVEPDAERDDAQKWMRDICHEIAQLGKAPTVKPRQRLGPLQLQLDQTKEEYLSSIAECQSAIADGESYQICLTNKIRYRDDISGLDLYRLLRNSNPAPFACYLSAGEVEIVSASPERFLSVSESGVIETKPIKGTARRDADPEIDRQLAEQLLSSEKDRAENLMIVDLLRNDLSRVSKVDTVSVPGLIKLESYTTVHQLVSTITAELREDVTLIELIRATFPGGSITGAPKLRSMELLDSLERSARGPYCGSIGYMGYNRVLDLNIGIRTMVVDQTSVQFGVGGGITFLSDKQAEFEEIMLKANALISALCSYYEGENGPAEYQINDNQNGWRMVNENPVVNSENEVCLQEKKYDHQ